MIKPSSQSTGSVRLVSPLNIIETLDSRSFTSERQETNSQLQEARNQFKSQATLKLNEAIKALTSLDEALDSYIENKETLFMACRVIVWIEAISEIPDLESYKSYHRETRGTQLTKSGTPEDESLQQDRANDAGKSYVREVKQHLKKILDVDLKVSDPKLVIHEALKVFLGSASEMPELKKFKGAKLDVTGELWRAVSSKLGRVKELGSHVKIRQLRDSYRQSKKSRQEEFSFVGDRTKQATGIMQSGIRVMSDFGKKELFDDLKQQTQNALAKISSLSKSKHFSLDGKSLGHLMEAKERVERLYDDSATGLTDWRNSFEIWTNDLKVVAGSLRDQAKGHLEKLSATSGPLEDLKPIASKNIAALENHIRKTLAQSKSASIEQAILAFAFYSAELQDAPKADAALQKILTFPNSEIRSALSILIKSGNLIDEATSELIIKSLEKRATTNKSEARPKKIGAKIPQDLTEEEILVSEMIAEYSSDKELAKEISRGLSCDHFDHVLTRLQFAVSAEIATELLKQNPALFHDSLHKALFDDYCHLLIQNTDQILREYSNGELRPAKYADHTSLKETIRADQEARSLANERAVICKSITLLGSHGELCMLILESLSTGERIHKKTLGQILAPRMEELKTQQADLANALTFLSEERCIIGSSTFELNLSDKPNAGPKNPAMQEALAFRLRAEI